MPRRAGRHFLQIPGPTNVPDRVLRAIDFPTIDHRGPEFAVLGKEVLANLKRVFKTTQGQVVIYPASGTGAWEAALVNTLSPGDRVLMAETGHFATLWQKMAVKLGLEVEFLPGDWRHGADPDAIDLIAERVDTNIRALEGALIRVVAYGSLTGRPVTVELADEVLAGLYPGTRAERRSVKDIQERICTAFDVSMDDLLSASRAAPVTWPRQVAMYLARELTDQTLPQIGRAFGGRNHTTVLHACKRTAERIADDPEAYELVRQLTEALGGPRRAS